MPVLSQERPDGLNNSVFICGNENLWSVAHLTDNPRAAVISASCTPLVISLKHYDKVSIATVIAIL